jgi:DeoR/GlpR family transcriptional regulator of sugar metabolism
VLRAARDAAARTVALVDATKFGRASLVSIARAQDLDLIISDSGLDSELAGEFRDAGVRLQIP